MSETFIDKIFECLSTEIESIEESDHNIKEFHGILTHYIDYLVCYVAVVRNTDNDSICYMNLASLFLLFDRPIFFRMIVEEKPHLLWQRTFDSSTQGRVPIVTPLEVAVGSRDPVKLSFITKLAEFNHYKKENPIDYHSLITHCIKIVYESYNLPATKNEKSIIDQLYKCEKMSPK